MLVPTVSIYIILRVWYVIYSLLQTLTQNLKFKTIVLSSSISTFTLIKIELVMLLLISV